RVFDPRPRSLASATPESYALIRHLTEAAAANVDQCKDFPEKFSAAAAVQHPHVAASYEVLEIQGRPAVLQEWVDGLAATEWPALFAVSGVWFRLLSQAALGLATAHQAGLVHGHLHPSLLVLTCEGTLKIVGFGEPHWLASPETLPELQVDQASPR